MFGCKFLILQHEQIQKLCGMECLWCLFGHRRQDGNCDHPDQAVFYLCLSSHDGFSYYYLYGTGIPEEYPEVCNGGEEKSLVLFIMSNELSEVN